MHEGTKGRKSIMGKEEGSNKFTARQKTAMYITTIALAAFAYLAPDLLKFIVAILTGGAKFVAALPEVAWKAVMIPLLVLVVGGILVSLYAVWQVFSTGKLAIKRSVPDLGGHKDK